MEISIGNGKCSATLSRLSPELPSSLSQWIFFLYIYVSLWLSAIYANCVCASEIIYELPCRFLIRVDSNSIEKRNLIALKHVDFVGKSRLHIENKYGSETNLNFQVSWLNFWHKFFSTYRYLSNLVLDQTTNSIEGLFNTIIVEKPTDKILALWERFCQQINNGMMAICVHFAENVAGRWNCWSHLLTWLAEAPEPILLIHTNAMNTRRRLALIQTVLAKRSCEPWCTIAPECEK